MLTNGEQPAVVEIEYCLPEYSEFYQLPVTHANVFNSINNFRLSFSASLDRFQFHKTVFVWQQNWRK